MKTFAEFSQLDEGAQEEARRRKQMRDGRLPKGGINATTKPSVTPKETPALSASPDVDAARRRRKAREANATPALSASPDVQKARDKRNMKNQVRKAPSISSKPADKASDFIRHKNNPAKTPDDNVAGAADKLKAKRAEREAGESKPAPQSGPQSRPSASASASVSAKKKPGIGSGLKSSMGGDIFSKDDKQRSKAREKLGQSAGKAVRSAPGKLFKSISKSQTTQDGPGESSSGSIDAPKRGVYNG